jgi:acetoin utilization deacetylase AcuC-like enzyme
MWSRIKSWLPPWGRPGAAAPGPRFVIHRRYQLDSPFPQYDARRPFRILSYLEKRGLLSKGMLRRPRPVSIAQLELVHSRDYLRSMEQPGALEPILGVSLDPRSQDKFLCFQRMVSGGTLRAARIALRRRDVAVNLGGGFHHAAADKGSGFCVFNDVALAIAALRAKGHEFPILVVDLDLHDGDGTRAIFAQDPTVHTFSIHNKDLGSTAAIASTSVALGTEVDDATYLAAVHEHLPRVIRDFQPGLVFFLAGSDPSIDDRLGDWRISLDGLLARDRFVLEKIGHVPTVILLAGGYGPRAWRHGAALFSWLLTGDSNLDIPLEFELPVDHYRRLTRHMRHPALMPDEEFQDPGAGPGPAPGADEDDWGLREEDVGLPGQSPDSRFLGLISRYGVEMALEEYGLMDALRALGFKELRVAIDLDDPLGHTLRVQTGGIRPKVVFETRLRIMRGGPAGFNYLAVEWLLIQDARSSFEISRPLLPGQKYPGLGLLRDTTAVLIVLCERLDLDGLIFTPSHFHLGAMSRPLAFNPDPVEEGRFQAVMELLKDVRLREAARIVESGGMVEEETGEPLQWKPSPLVIPASARLKEHFAADEFTRLVKAARSACRLARL